jgi:hypothetical protein
VLVALVVLDVTDESVRTWFSAHAFTTDAVVSLLVLIITVLNVDRVVNRRQQRERRQVTAAQAAIVARQAQRATDLVRAALGDGSQRDAASDELRTYMAMLLVSAPILIEAASARTFLESAQPLGGLLSHALAQGADTDRLTAAVQAVNAAARPLLASLDLAQRTAVDGDG